MVVVGVNELARGEEGTANDSTTAVKIVKEKDPPTTAGLDVLCRHKKNILPRDQEGYGGFEYTDEKLSKRRIQWCGVKLYIFVFGDIFLKNR